MIATWTHHNSCRPHLAGAVPRTYVRPRIVAESHAQARAQWLAQDKLSDKAYKEFIEAASKCNYRRASSTTSRTSCTGRALRKGWQDAHPSSPKASKARFGRTKGRDAYLVPETRPSWSCGDDDYGSIDLLREFGEACRAEFDSLRSQFFRSQF